MVIDSTGNVGIGTTSPSSDISGSATVLEIEDSNIASLALNHGTTGKFEVAASGLGLYFGHNGASKMVIQSSGNVGIGTSSPFTNLTVYGATDSRIALINSNSGTTSSDGFVMILEDDSEVNFLNRESAAIKFATAGTERLRIDSSGNVKFNTSAQIGYYEADGVHDGYIVPYNSSGQLEIVSSFSTGGILFKTGTSKTERMRIDSSGTVQITKPATAGIVEGLVVMNPINSAGTGHGASILLHSTPGAPSRGVKIASSSTSNFALDNDMLFYTSASQTLTEKMRITSGGEIQATNKIKSPLYYSYSGSFTSSSGNWVNVHLLEQSEFKNRTIIASAFVLGTHSYASATINVIHNGGSYLTSIGNKLADSGADLRVNGGYLQFYVTPWSASSSYRLTVN
jgi:hypothetical protein